MSTWIQSLKKYHEEKGTKYKIPKKGSEEYSIILKFHNDIKGKTVVSEPIIAEKKVKVKSKEKAPHKPKKEEVVVKRVRKPKKTEVADDIEVELIQDE